MNCKISVAKLEQIKREFFFSVPLYIFLEKGIMQYLNELKLIQQEYF